MSSGWAIFHLKVFKRILSDAKRSDSLLALIKPLFLKQIHFNYELNYYKIQ